MHACITRTRREGQGHRQTDVYTHRRHSGIMMATYPLLLEPHFFLTLLLCLECGLPITACALLIGCLGLRWGLILRLSRGLVCGLGRLSPRTGDARQQISVRLTTGVKLFLDASLPLDFLAQPHFHLVLLRLRLLLVHGLGGARRLRI